MDADIADIERLAIFVLDSDYMREDGATWRAFLPDKHSGERSFYRVDGLDFCDIAAIGQVVASTRAPKTLRGWAIITAIEVRKLQGLQLKIDEPPDRHGVIHSWPPEKEDMRSFAQSLADAITTTTIRFPFAP
jgi:hypothetical protein